MRCYPSGPLVRGTLAAALFLGLAPRAEAQRYPSGPTLGVAGMAPHAALGGGSPGGWAAGLILGRTERLSLDVGVTHVATGQTEGTEPRRYTLWAPHVGLRAGIVGERTNLGLVLGGGASRYSLAASTSGASPAESRLLPFLDAGLSLRLPVVRSLVVDLNALDRITHARDGELGSAPGARGWQHNPTVRVSLGWLRTRREPTVGNADDLPLSYHADFRPVDASAVARPGTLATKGRDHLHTDEGASIGIRAVPAEELSGRSAPGSVSIVAPTGPSMLFVEDLVGTVYFASGSAAVSPTYRVLLSDVARFLRQNPSVQVALVAYADSTGGVRLNASLAQQRGTAVQDLLVRVFDIAPSRVTVTAVGSDYRATADASARRVEIVTRTPRSTDERPGRH